MKIARILHSFLPQRSAVPFAERLLSAVAAGVGLFLLAGVLELLSQPHAPLLLLSPMGASALLLYAAPHSPFAQPWNLVAGHLVSAVAAWVTLRVTHDPLLSAGLAVGAAIFVMYLFECLHPPAAGTALTLILSAHEFQQMGFVWTLTIVAANALIALLLALIINNALPRRHYPPVSRAQASPQSVRPVLPEPQDIERALAESERVLDVTLDDLIDLYARAQEHAQRRQDSHLDK